MLRSRRAPQYLITNMNITKFNRALCPIGTEYMYMYQAFKLAWPGYKFNINNKLKEKLLVIQLRFN